MAIKISGSTIIDDSRNIVAGVAATFTGNVTVGGTITYEDVTNVDSVGVITARTGIQIPNDTYKLRAGTDLEMQVFHNGSDSIIKDTRNSGTVKVQADNFSVIDKDASQTMLAITETSATFTGVIDANSTLEVAGVANFDSNVGIWNY